LRNKNQFSNIIGLSTLIEKLKTFFLRSSMEQKMEVRTETGENPSLNPSLKVNLINAQLCTFCKFLFRQETRIEMTKVDERGVE
jgi:hypothetical protein